MFLYDGTLCRLTFPAFFNYFLIFRLDGLVDTITYTSLRDGVMGYQPGQVFLFDAVLVSFRLDSGYKS